MGKTSKELQRQGGLVLCYHPQKQRKHKATQRERKILIWFKAEGKDNEQKPKASHGSTHLYQSS